MKVVIILIIAYIGINICYNSTMKQSYTKTQAVRHFDSCGWSQEIIALILTEWDKPNVQEVVRYALRRERLRIARTKGTQVPRPFCVSVKKPIPRRTSKAVFERDAYRCCECSTWLNLTVDHILPEIKGGTLALSNLRTLCQSCNSRKGARVDAP